MKIINKNFNGNKLKIIDNFLNDEDYQDLLNLDIKNNINKKFNIYHNEINDNGIITSTIDKKLIERLHKNYHSKAMLILKEINKDKAELYDYSDFTIIVTEKDSKFPIHDDTPNKLLSGVIYLSPKKNNGTSFYADKQGTNKTHAEWKTNRGVFFSRKERNTWHSYEGDGINNRVVLVYNLMTYKIKKVYDIEKKNFFLGNLRWKINPYLHEYFKFII
jgi:hypothetical protein|tara:strand:+ start:824 stop:1477 length:654 start_codon:yes stop_codon:yes gene_type:complete